MKGETFLSNLSVNKDKIFDDIDEVIEILSRKGGSSRPPAFLWSKVSHKVHRQLLEMIAKELNLPNPRFIASKRSGKT